MQTFLGFRIESWTLACSYPKTAQTNQFPGNLASCSAYQYEYVKLRKIYSFCFCDGVVGLIETKDYNYSIYDNLKK